MAALVWFLPGMCLHMYYKLTMVQEILSHWLHCYGGFIRWLLRSLLREKALPQSLHWYGFSPVCVLTCIIRASFPEKALSQWLHWYSISPVCVLICLTSVLLCKNTLPHWLHWYGLSPVCVFRCVLRLLLFEKGLSHWLYCYDFSSLCFLGWLISWLLCKKKTYHNVYIEIVYRLYVLSDDLQYNFLLKKILVPHIFQSLLHLLFLHIWYVWVPF